MKLPSMPSRLRWIVTSAYWIVLTRALLVSSPWQELGAYHFAKEPDPSDPVSSFSLHASAYGVLGILLLWSTSRARARTKWTWLAVAVFHGAICEGLQGFIPNRWPNVADVVANAAGLAIAALVAAATHRLLSATKSPAAPFHPTEAAPKEPKRRASR